MAKDVAVIHAAHACIMCTYIYINTHTYIYTYMYIYVYIYTQYTECEKWQRTLQ